MSVNSQNIATNAPLRANQRSFQKVPLTEKGVQNSQRPTTAPAIRRSSSIDDEKTQSGYVSQRAVPSKRTNQNYQPRQQRPQSSVNTRKTTSRNSSLGDRPQSAINTNVSSKLRQDRNYQPPRRRTRKSQSPGNFNDCIYPTLSIKIYVIQQ